MDAAEASGGGREEVLLPLSESTQGKCSVAYRVFAMTVFVGTCLILFYRLLYIPRAGEGGRWAWLGMFMAELLFGFHWFISQSLRWHARYSFPHKNSLSLRYEEKLPDVDIFVCTADPVIEPPIMVMSTVLSAVSFNYPPQKLSVYLSDDGGSELTFYALLEASRFSKDWIPFCKRFNVEPRSPEAYFAQEKSDKKNTRTHAQEWLAIKKQYEEMKRRIESATAHGSVPKEIRDQHRGFLEWNPGVTKQNHQSIVQIITNRKDTDAVDNEGCRLPTMVYMAREKRPGCLHNFKAGAMNALIRVSSEISDAPFILNLDCDVYANNPDAIREALCFFMDEKTGHEIAFVQHPQRFRNITKNDIYANHVHVVPELELHGMDGYGAMFYCGTGCLHRRKSLFGAKHSKDCKGHTVDTRVKKNYKTVDELEDASKVLASCNYEQYTQWGKELGLMYGCAVEDIVTGLAIQCRGWKSVYYNPEKRAFMGLAPNTLEVALVQYKRCFEGMFQIFLSKYCPIIYGHKKIALGAQMGYSFYLLCAPLSLPTLYYVIVPPLCLFHGIFLFPKVSSLWFIPFAYVFILKNAYSLFEAMSCGTTLRIWWNLQRMQLIRKTSAFFLAFIDVILKQLGLSQTAFAITVKVVTEDVLKRYEQEVMEFGSSSLMFTIISTLAMLNLFSLVTAIFKVIFLEFGALEKLVFQVMLCGVMVVLNFPIYEALFIRKDKGSLPFSVMFKSISIASLACLIPVN